MQLLDKLFQESSSNWKKVGLHGVKSAPFFMVNKKEQEVAVPYSFRHSYSKRAHQVYKLSDTEVAAFMGHTVPVHNATYSQWSSEAMLEDSMERAIKFRDLTS